MKISLEIKPRDWTRKLGGYMAQKLPKRKVPLRQKLNVMYCKTLLKLQKS